MPVEATDVDQPFEAPDDAPQEKEQDAPQEKEKDAPPAEPVEPPDAQDAPKRGRPAGSKDTQPRKRPERAASVERPVTRRSAPPRKTTKRVRIESASEESDEMESPRTARHRQWAEFRQHKNDAHQASVNRYASLFDRMLA